MVRKILIADDSSYMRTMLKGILTKAGYEIASEAGSGEEVLQQYRAVKPDLVTMDIVMLGEGGLRAVKEIMRFDSRAKILMVSAMGQQALVVEAIQAGAKGFVVKPFEADQLQAEVKRILGESQ